MDHVRDYRNLEVWRRSHALVLRVLVLVDRFPADERYELTRQMRRSAMSVPTNIAEGAGRASRPDYARFLDMAASSLNELEYQVLLAHDLSYPSDPMIEEECGEIRAMLTSLRTRVLAGDRGLATGD